LEELLSIKSCKRFDARPITTTQSIVLDGKYIRTKCEEDHDLEGTQLLMRTPKLRLIRCFTLTLEEDRNS
jgi:hypothetical protein